MSQRQKPDIGAGLIAGALGGIAGAAAKVLCEKIVPPRPPGREAPPGVLAEKISRAAFETSLTDEQKASTSNVVHWTFSIVTGAAYGAIVEYFPDARAGFGTAFGEFVWVTLHELTLPLSGATPKLPDLPVSEQANEFVSHAIFGAAVEGVRGLIRS